MIRKSSEARPIAVARGITRRTLTAGDAMMLVEFTLEPGAVFPEHSHAHEQIGYLCKGSGRLWIGEEAVEIGPGSSWCIPRHVPHKAEFSQDSIAVDVFHPAREDYRDPEA